MFCLWNLTSLRSIRPCLLQICANINKLELIYIKHKCIRKFRKLFHDFVLVLLNHVACNFSSKVENLHSTDDGEPSEKSHGASNGRQHVHKLCCSVLGDFVKCWGIKVNFYKSQLALPDVS